MRARIAALLTIALSLLGLICSGSAIASEANPAFTPTANEILPDSAFTESTMSTAAEIQEYLEKHYPNGCLTHYMAPEPINYFEYNSSHLVPASQVIAFAAAYAERVSSRIPLTMLEEQEGLASGDGPYGCSPVAYETAMGFDCPGPPVQEKTGNCVEEPDDVGFSQQVVKGTWQLEFGFQRAQGDANLGWGENNTVCYYGPELEGTRKRCEQASPETFTGEYTFSSTAVKVANAATATLYAYTPALQPFGRIYLELFGSAEEKPVETKEPPKETPKEEPPVESKEPPAEEPKEESKEPPKEEPPVETKEPPKEESKEVPKEEPKEPPKEEPPVETKEPPKETPKEESKEEKPVEKPTEPVKEKEPVKEPNPKSETPPVIMPPVVPPGTSTGVEPAAPVQIPTTVLAGPKAEVGTPFHEIHRLVKPKPKAKPKKKVCRKHGKKVRCPVKKTHRKNKKK
jgi:hypothetical protein